METKTKGFTWDNKGKSPFPDSMIEPSIIIKREDNLNIELIVLTENRKKKLDSKLKKNIVKLLLISFISPFLFLILHELFHIFVGSFLGIKIEGYNLEIRYGLPFFIIHFEETSSKLIQILVYSAGSLGMILFGLNFLIYGIFKKKPYIYYFGCLAIQQDIFYIGISCMINEGDWSSIFFILGLESNIYFYFGIMFLIFYFLLYLIELLGILKFGVEWIDKKK